MGRSAGVAARTVSAPRARAAAPARHAPPRRRARPAAKPRRAIRVVPRGTARPAAATIGAGVLDRLLRGRAWIACIGALLAGVVFLNVSLLELNHGITQKAERSAELKRDNAQLRLRVAALASSERIQQAAATRGFVLPAPAEVQYLKPRRADAGQAAQRMQSPPPGALQGSDPAPPQAGAPVQQAPAPQAETPAAGQPPPATQAPPGQAPAQQAPPAAAAPPAAGTGAQQAPAAEAP